MNKDSKTMDYKEKYENALKRAKAIIEIAANKDEAIGFANTIFPEFKRERDESIRKLLIKTIKQVPNDSLLWETIDKSSVLIWLEKQGEQKPAIFIPKFHVGDKLVSTKNPSLTYEVLEVGHINELGNQDYKVEIFTDRKVENPRNIQYIECYKVDEWAELIEQKLSWSEEDELNLKQAIYVCHQNGYTAVENWLKSLKDRVQPHWKPTDKQMHAFEQVYDWYNNNFAASETLTSLYQDLKKLKR